MSKIWRNKRKRSIQGFSTTFILHNRTAATLVLSGDTLAVVRLLIECKGCNMSCGGTVSSSQGLCITGGSAEWKGLKCNAFEMKWKGAEEWNMTRWLLGPGVTGQDLICSCMMHVLASVCVCVWVGEKIQVYGIMRVQVECVMWCRLPLVLWLPLPPSCSGLMEIKGH